MILAVQSILNGMKAFSAPQNYECLQNLRLTDHLLLIEITIYASKA